jgi:hypothetical protein
MPIYKLVSNLNERLSHNGKFYAFGDTVIDRVVLTEEEAKIMNRNQTGTILVLLDKGPKVQENVQESEPEKVEVKGNIALWGKERLIEKVKNDLPEYVLTGEETKQDLLKILKK